MDGEQSSDKQYELSAQSAVKNTKPQGGELGPTSCRMSRHADVCVFTPRSHLKLDIVIHSDTAQSLFNADAQQSKKVGSVEVHLRVHTGKKFHQCDICNKTFARKAAFKCHLQMHAREKRHELSYLWTDIH